MAYPTGYTQATAVQAVRDRTNAIFGQPLDLTITNFLNAGIEQVVLDTDAILTSVAIAIPGANTTTLALPADIGQIRNLAYTTGLMTVAGTSAYPLALVPFDQYLVATQASPAGGLGGIASLATIVQDENNALTLQIYPLVSSGYVYVYYYQRPQLWDPLTPSSVTTLDSAFQEPVILWACARTMEAQEQDNRADRFHQQYVAALERAETYVKRRGRKNQSNVVQDVAIGIDVWPSWARG